MVDGKSLLRGLREVLNEASDSEYLDDRTSYGYLWQAAIEFTDRTSSLTATQDITTVANQQNYTLNADYLRMYLKNMDNNYYLKYNDGSADTFILFKEKEDIIYQNSTASQSIPNSFYIEDDVLDSRIQGNTASANGGSTGGESVLTDTVNSPFADVSGGDVVHNGTDSSDGVVLSNTSNSALVTALFDGTNNDWTAGDSYVIQPQARHRIVLSPPSSTSAHTITVYYVQRPAPVFSDYGTYRIPPQYFQALVFYAAWLYKYRDRAPNFGDRYYQYFDNQVRKSSVSVNRSLKRKGFKVNFRKRP